MNITSKQARAMGIDVPARNKYGAKKTVYNGVKYDSLAEADRAAELDAMLVAGEIAWWLRQIQIPLGSPNVTLRVDFVIGYRVSGVPKGLLQVYAEEVKGFEGERFRVLKKLWPKFGLFPLHILKRNGRGWDREVVSIDGM